MNQDDKHQNNQRQPLIIPKRPIARETPLQQQTTAGQGSHASGATNETAANILRSNIDEIYKATLIHK